MPGPFTKSELSTVPNQSQMRWDRNWYTQPLPRVNPLPYRYTYDRAFWAYKHPKATSLGTPLYNSVDRNWHPLDVPSAYSYVYAQAYNKLQGKLKPDTAGMAVNLAQRVQAFEMIAKRLQQLLSFTRAVRRFDLRGMMSALDIKWQDRPRKWRKLETRRSLKRRFKKPADLWLEFHFGWSPLVGDVYSSCDILQKGIPPSQVRAFSKGKQNWYKKSTVSTNGSYRDWQHADSLGVGLGAEVRVTNPGLWLLNQLGAVNPALVAYDMVPFSFVLNWFVNIEEFLGAYTDTLGLTFGKQYRTLFSRRTTVERSYQGRWPTSSDVLSHYYTINSESVTCDRTVGPIARPALHIRAPWAMSWRRGLTSISLLIQQMQKCR